MNYQKHIERRPDVLVGKPVIKGTRISVELIIRKLAGGYSIADLIKQYPHLSDEKIKAALEYAADVIAHEDSLESA